MGYYNFFGTTTSLEAESKTVHVGLRLMARVPISFLWLELDSLILVQILKNIWSVPWNLCYYAAAIKEELSRYVIIISHIYREGDELPLELRGIYLMDRTLLPNIRGRSY